MKNLLRSLLALIAGYVVATALTLVTVPLLGAIAPATLDAANGWSVWLNIAYGAVFAALGGYVASRLAPSSPFVHALILGALMSAAAVATGIAVASAPPTADYYQPSWYYTALAVTTLPAVAFGGWLFSRKA